MAPVVGLIVMPVGGEMSEKVNGLAGTSLSLAKTEFDRAVNSLML